MDPIPPPPVGLLQSSEAKRRSPPAASRFARRSQQPSPHAASVGAFHPLPVEEALQQGGLHLPSSLILPLCTKAHAGREAGRNPSQSITASGEQLLACILHPALYRTGGNADRQGQGQETKRGQGFAEILARRPQICSPFHGPSRTPFLSTGSMSRLLPPGGPGFCAVITTLGIKIREGAIHATVSTIN